MTAASQQVCLGEVVRHVKDRVDPDKANLQWYVAGAHMNSGDLRLGRRGRVGDGYLGPAFHMRFRPGQVLYGSRRTYLRKVAVADFEGVTSNTTFVLETVDPMVLLPGYLPLVLQSERFTEHSVRESKGSVNPYVNFSDLAWFEFHLPSVDEQRRVVTALEAADGCVDRLTTLKRRGRGLWRSLIEQHAERFGSAPVPLGELLTGITAGKSLVGIDEAWAGGQPAVLKVSAIDPDGFRSEEAKVLSEPDRFDDSVALTAGDLLMSRANTSELVGESCLVDRDYQNLMLSDKTLRLVPRPDVDSRLLWHVLQSTDVRHQIVSRATGTGSAMKNISQKKILALMIPYPGDRSTATEVVDAFDRAHETSTSLQARVHQARSVRTALLTKALEGEEQ